MDPIAHDGEAALESGYGQRPFPQLTGSLFEPEHPLAGVPERRMSQIVQQREGFDQIFVES